VSEQLGKPEAGKAEFDLLSADPRSSQELGRFVRQVRKAKGLTQAEMAGLAGVGVRYLSELERGKATSHLGKALQVLHRLGCRLALEARVPRSLR